MKRYLWYVILPVLAFVMVYGFKGNVITVLGAEPRETCTLLEEDLPSGYETVIDGVTWKIVSFYMEQTDNNLDWYNVVEVITPQTTPSSTPSTEPSCGHGNVESRVIREATVTTDGIMEYYCRDCGDKLREEVIGNSAFNCFHEEMIEDIENAPEGGTVVIEGGDWHTLTRDTMEALAGRRDITVEITLSYEGDVYHYVIPAGTYIYTHEEYYGPLFLGHLYGMTKVEE